MQVHGIMTENPACCTPIDPVERAARLMVEYDCGEIPVVANLEACNPIGVITDRDITCRTIGKGLDALRMTVGECMSTPLVFVRPEDNIYDCSRLMEEHQVRRLPVVDAGGACVGYRRSRRHRPQSVESRFGRSIERCFGRYGNCIERGAMTSDENYAVARLMLY